MSLRKALDIRRTLVFRLTFWHAIVFTASFFVAVTVFYFVISNLISEHTDQEMLKELSEANAILKSKGEDSFHAEMGIEAAAEGVENIFFRLLDAEGREIAATSMSSWKGIGVNKSALASAGRDLNPVFETVSLPGKTYQARILYAPLKPGRVLQIGYSLEDDARFLETFRSVFIPGILIFMALSAVIGWFVASRALAGVRDVTRTALEISEGAFDKRVRIQDRGDEVEKLAVTFNRMLDRINELVKRLREVTDDIAHDLRTPIARIRGMAEAELISGKPGEEVNRLAADTVEECDSLLHMINTMLEIAELEAGIPESSKAEVDLTQMVGEAVELFRPIAEEKGVQLISPEAGRVMLRGNMHGLQRIILNLLDNAIKYTESGGNVSVSLQDHEGRVEIIVRDTGIGIPEEDQQFIFDRLYRCDDSRSQPGFGLGLSLASAVARAHGGGISVASAPGKGSTFTASLPK
jgi:heavy metal sensor kinase